MLRGKILIVDDMPEVRLTLKQALTRPGVTIFEADSGRLAIEIHRRERLDLIILDFAMPGLDGEEVARRIRADRTLRDVSILMISDDTHDVIRARARAAGANAFLPKRLQLSELRACVERLLHVATRKATQLLAQVVLSEGPGASTPFIGRILNVSTTGMLLETDAEMALGRDVEVTFSVPGSLTRVRATARVMRRAQGSGTAKWGLRFTMLDPAGQRGLKEFIARTTAQGNP